jgi:hypothetical protein
MIIYNVFIPFYPKKSIKTPFGALIFPKGLKQPLPNFFFMIGIQTWFELSINYFEDFGSSGKKGFLFFFRGLNMNPFAK